MMLAELAQRLMYDEVPLGADASTIPVIYQDGSTFAEIHEVEYRDGALYLRSHPKLSKSRAS